MTTHTLQVVQHLNPGGIESWYSTLYALPPTITKSMSLHWKALKIKQLRNGPSLPHSQSGYISSTSLRDAI